MKKKKPRSSAQVNETVGDIGFTTRNPRWIEYSLIPLSFLIITALVSRLHPSLWGLILFPYLSAPLNGMAVVAAILILSRPYFLELQFRGFRRLGSLLFPTPSSFRSWLIHGVLSVGMVLLASAYRMPFSFLGDGASIVRTLYTDAGGLFSFPGTLWIEPLTVFLYKLLLHFFAEAPSIGSGVDLRSYTQVFALISVGAVGPFTLLVLRLWPRITEDPALRLTGTLMTLASGGLLLFFGYVEYYAPMYILGTGVLLSSVAVLKDGRFPALPWIFFAAAMLFHLSTLILLVPLLVLMRERAHREGSPAHPWRLPFGLLGFGFLAYLALNLAGLNRFFIPLTSQTDGFAFLTVRHFLDILNTVLLHGGPPAALLLGWIVFHKGRMPTTPALRVSLAAVLTLILLVAVHSAIARDWDVYALLGPALALTAILAWEGSPALPRDRMVPLRLTAPLHALGSVLLVVIWVAVNVHFPSAFRRFDDLTRLYEPILPASVSAGHLETLRTAAVAGQDRNAEAWFMMRAFLLTADHYDFYKMQRALSAVPVPTATLRLSFVACIDKALSIPPAGRRFPPAEQGLDSLRFNDLIALSFGKYASMLLPNDRWTWIQSHIARLDGRDCTRGLIASLLGRAAADLGRWKDAEQYLQLALRDSSGLVQRDGAQLARGLAIAFLQQNRIADASEIFRQSTTLPGATADCWAGWGYSLLRQNRLDEAVKVFVTTLEKDPDNKDGLFFLGKLYLSRPEYRARGEELLIRYVTKHPTASNTDQAKALLGGKTP